LWRGSTNIVTNGGFESNATNWSANNGAVARSTAQNKFGTASLQVTPNGAGASEGTFSRAGGHGYAASPSVSYSASMWLYSSVARDVHMGFDEYTAADVFITSGSVNASLPAGRWTRVTYTRTTSGTAAFVVPFVYTNDATGGVTPFYVDGVQVEQQPYATPYIETNGATASRSAAYVTAPTRLLNASRMGST
jgi:hypothetical protein